MGKLSRRSISIHEAGHVCANFFLFGQPIGAVVFDGEGGGLCTPSPEAAEPYNLSTAKTAKELSSSNDTKITARQLLNECVFFAAGYCSQETILHECGQMLYFDNGDNRLITGHFLAIHPDASEDEITGFLSLAHIMARSMVKRYKKYILNVALQLNQRGTLTATESLEILLATLAQVRRI
ncbi:MAG: hypothetical protein WCP12_09535 [bacterium]